MLTDVLIVAMWPKWVHKHLQEVTKNVFSWEKLYIDFPILYQKIFCTVFEDDDFNCTGKFYYRYGNFYNKVAVTGCALKIQIKVSQNSRENTDARPASLLKNRLQHRCVPVNFVEFLRIPFLKATVSQNIKPFKLQRLK